MEGQSTADDMERGIGRRAPYQDLLSEVRRQGTLRPDKAPPSHKRGVSIKYQSSLQNDQRFNNSDEGFKYMYICVSFQQGTTILRNRLSQGLLGSSPLEECKCGCSGNLEEELGIAW